jgi:hypothetical protein
VLAANVLGLNPWLDLLVGFVVVGGAIWGMIWGAIKVWHKQATKNLEEKFQPYFKQITDTQTAEGVELKRRLASQDAILGNIEHEVTYNSGESLKDRVKDMGEKVDDVMGALTTDAPTALNPFPRLGVIDTQRVQGEAIAQIGRDVSDLKSRKAPT